MQVTIGGTPLGDDITIADSAWAPRKTTSILHCREPEREIVWEQSALWTRFASAAHAIIRELRDALIADHSKQMRVLRTPASWAWRMAWRTQVSSWPCFVFLPSLDLLS
jgi:hypothetical protein